MPDFTLEDFQEMRTLQAVLWPGSGAGSAPGGAGTPSPAGAGILQEDGVFLILQEMGDDILQEGP